MPLPLIPIIAGIAAVAGIGVGVKKGMDAKEDFDRAKWIAENAKDRHESAVKSLQLDRKRTEKAFLALGKFKADIFTTQIKYLVDAISRSKQASSRLKDYEQQIEELDVPKLKTMVTMGLELKDMASGAASGAISGALAGLGAYGSVGLLASASTGTAIAGLSGVAATNATLAWLGGGSLAAGGFGMAGGMAVLGGIVAGPAIAIAGLVLASKAEEALSQARDYEAKADVAVEEIGNMRLVLAGLMENVKEMSQVLSGLIDAFEQTKVPDDSNENAFVRMLAVGKALKEVLDTPIMEKDGNAVRDLKSTLKVKISGLLEYRG
jgi:hypothetical protein